MYLVSGLSLINIDKNKHIKIEELLARESIKKASVAAKSASELGSLINFNKDVIGSIGNLEIKDNLNGISLTSSSNQFPNIRLKNKLNPILDNKDFQAINFIEKSNNENNNLSEAESIFDKLEKDEKENKNIKDINSEMRKLKEKVIKKPKNNTKKNRNSYKKKNNIRFGQGKANKSNKTNDSDILRLGEKILEFKEDSNKINELLEKITLNQ